MHKIDEKIDDEPLCPTCGDPTWRAGWDCDECAKQQNEENENQKQKR